MSIYTDIKAADLPTDSHESDLYVKDSPEAREILAEHGKKVDGWNVQGFKSAIDGAHWLDIPFAFDPWWTLGTR
jgi:hypothetical protein